MAEIWDCFLFNDELALLETRLAELGDVVDRFVLVEADHTHAGQQKPLVYEQSRARFSAWNDRIVHVVARLDPTLPSAWNRESQHRGAIGDYVEAHAKPDDLIMVSDIDEIPDADVMGYLVERSGPPVRLQQHHAIYHANWLLPRMWTNSTLVFRGDQQNELMTRLVMGRESPGWADYREVQLADSGVHLSFLGGVEAIRRKLAAYAHQEYNDERVKATVHIERCITCGVHFEGREVLRRVPREELNPMLRRLSERSLSAGLFDFTPAPLSSARARAYAAYAWLRIHWRGFPIGMMSYIDRHPGSVIGAGAPAFWAVDAALRARRRLRPSDDQVRGIVEDRRGRWLPPIIERWR